MSAIDQYWNKQAGQLRAQFDEIRSVHIDSDAKGAGNEQIVAELIRRNMAHKAIVTNCSIIDTRDQRSSEVDVAICNEYQPFLSRPLAEILLVEGVDAVVQVKARLDSEEIKRIVRNCRTVKRLVRSAHKDDQCYSNQHDVPHFVDRVPYITFAFDSALSAATVLTRIQNEYAGLSSEEQLDAVFVLDKFTVLNVRDNTGIFKLQATGSRQARGFESIATGDSTLSDMMWFLYTAITKFIRWQHPVIMYNPLRQHGTDQPEIPD